MAVPTAPIVAGSMVGAYVVANATEHRQLGGVVMAVGGGVSIANTSSRLCARSKR